MKILNLLFFIFGMTAMLITHDLEFGIIALSNLGTVILLDK